MTTGLITYQLKIPYVLITGHILYLLQYIILSSPCLNLYESFGENYCSFDLSHHRTADLSEVQH